MKILIINQHTKNHGDEAAALALIRSLYENNYTDITVLYNMSTPDERCFHKYKNVKHLLRKGIIRGTSGIIDFFMKYPNFFTQKLPFLFSEIRRDYKAIKAADYIISAPGGVNIGLYRDTISLWRLIIALQLNKKVAIYSPSIGPFKSKDHYTKWAKFVFDNVNFLSLRDMQSYVYAEKLNVAYQKSIDTAFLEDPVCSIPSEVEELLPKKYVVIVPNQLYVWHPLFVHKEERLIDEFYELLIQKFLDNLVNVLLLPQLYCSKHNDEDYCRYLSRKFSNNVIVFSSNYTSDIQQYVIKKSMFVIGARYHTIVFSINNSVPFACLSYEHKMKNMLELLGVESLNVDINNSFASPDEIIKLIYNGFLNRHIVKNDIEKAREKAKSLAISTFQQLLVSLSIEYYTKK